jgi:hypothetical protein
MEAVCSFETSVNFQRTTRRCTPEDGTLHNHLTSPRSGGSSVVIVRSRIKATELSVSYNCCYYRPSRIDDGQIYNKTVTGHAFIT